MKEEKKLLLSADLASPLHLDHPVCNIAVMKEDSHLPKLLLGKFCGSGMNLAGLTVV